MERQIMRNVTLLLVGIIALSVIVGAAAPSVTNRFVTSLFRTVDGDAFFNDTHAVFGSTNMSSLEVTGATNLTSLNVTENAAFLGNVTICGSQINDMWQGCGNATLVRSIIANQCDGVNPCKIEITDDITMSGGDQININKSNLHFYGKATRITRTTDQGIFVCPTNSDAMNVSIQGFDLKDDVGTRNTAMIHARLCNSKDWTIQGNVFRNVPNGTRAIILGDFSDGSHNFTGAKILFNHFYDNHASVLYSGSDLTMIGNVGDRTAASWPSSESEMLDWNRGEGYGTISNNDCIDYGEQCFDINVKGVTVNNNYMRFDTDGSSTTGIIAYAADLGTISGNTIELSGDSQDNCIVVGNNDLPVTVTGNTCTGNGAGDGIGLETNNNIAIGNVLTNLTRCMIVSGNNNNIDPNEYVGCTQNINDSGTSNGFKTRTNVNLTGILYVDADTGSVGINEPSPVSDFVIGDYDGTDISPFAMECESSTGLCIQLEESGAGVESQQIGVNNGGDFFIRDSDNFNSILIEDVTGDITLGGGNYSGCTGAACFENGVLVCKASC